MSQVAGPKPPPSSRRRHLRRLAVGALFVLAAYLGRATLLRSLAQGLISDDGLSPCSRVTVLGGDRRYDAAAGLVTAGRAGGVLVVQTAPSRTQALGLRPSDEDTVVRELRRRGIGAERVELVPGRARGGWEWARQLGGWMDLHPDETVLVLADRFGSRQARLVLRRAMSSETFARVRVAALPHREYTEADWWRVKSGQLGCGLGFIDLGYAWVAGEAAPPEPATVEALEAVP